MKEKENKEEEVDNEIEFGFDDEVVLEEVMKEIVMKK